LNSLTEEENRGASQKFEWQEFLSEEERNAIWSDDVVCC
jgi:hypothetical protein